MNVLEDAPKKEPNSQPLQLRTCLSFTLEGQVCPSIKRCVPSLIAYIQQTIKQNQEQFRKEIEMATKTTFTRQVEQVVNELAKVPKRKIIKNLGQKQV